MNLPRLSDEEIEKILSTSAGKSATAILFATAEAQLALFEQWMREQKPVAHCKPDDPMNSTAFAWPGTDLEERHSTPLYAAPVLASQGDGFDAYNANGLAWAVARWRDEVSARPMINKNRRPLDDVWRQVVSYFGGDPDTLLGPSHDEMADAIAAPVTTKEAEG